MSEAKSGFVPIDEILKRLNNDPEYKARFYRSPSAFFEEELGMKMSSERKKEIDRVYAEVEKKAKDKHFQCPDDPDGPPGPRPDF